MHHAILNISWSSLHHYDIKLPNFTSPLYGVGELNTKIVAFFFLNLDDDRCGPKEKFAKICQLNEIEKDRWCHPNIFLSWQRDVTTSPLYFKRAMGLTVGRNRAKNFECSYLYLKPSHVTRENFKMTREQIKLPWDAIVLRFGKENCSFNWITKKYFQSIF